MISSKNKAISTVARAGFVAKGLVYLVVGLLTLRATMGIGVETSDATDAFSELIKQPFGSIALIVTIAGLIAHAIWKMLQGITDPENRGNATQVVAARISDFLTGWIYIFMAYTAWQILHGVGTEDGDETTQVWIARVMELPFGSWLVMCLAVAVFAGGLYQFYSAWTAGFDSSFSSKVSKLELQVLRWLGRIGVAAWGIVYCMVALLLYRASVAYDPDEAGGLSDALNALGEQPYGTWVLAITAVGLIIYSVYLLALSYYHKLFEDH